MGISSAYVFNGTLSNLNRLGYYLGLTWALKPSKVICVIHYNIGIDLTKYTQTYFR